MTSFKGQMGKFLENRALKYVEKNGHFCLGSSSQPNSGATKG